MKVDWEVEFYSEGYLLRLSDDGYRFWVTILSTSATNVPVNKPMVLMDYKQFDIGHVAHIVTSKIRKVFEAEQ